MWDAGTSWAANNLSPSAANGKKNQVYAKYIEKLISLYFEAIAKPGVFVILNAAKYLN
jgi:hypothetical protein